MLAITADLETITFESTASAAEVASVRPSKGAEVISIFDLRKQSGATQGEVGRTTDSGADNSAGAARLEMLFQSAFSELGQYAGLERGWDGYDGCEFSEQTVTRARDLLRDAVGAFKASGRSPQKITPGPVGDGSIDLELVSGDRSLLLTVSPHAPGTLHLYASDDSTDVDREIAPDKHLLDQWLRWLISSKSRSSPLAKV